MFSWKKMALIFPYTRGLQGTISHCQNPVPIFLKKDIVRVYFGSRNLNNFSQVYYFDFDLSNMKTIGFSEVPQLKPLLEFEKNGVYPTYSFCKDGVPHLFYTGFLELGFGKYRTELGLAIINNDGSISRLKNTPILAVSKYDPCLVTSPCVLFENGVYRMWYVSGYKWEKCFGDSWQSYYHIKYAESKDGIDWKRDGMVSIDHASSGETNIARPWIIKEDDTYEAWFSYSCGKLGYRIGYAKSRDGGYTFERMDHLAGIYLSDEPWENEAVSYPAVIVYKGLKYMFYNGNKFGKDGIALAVEEKI